MYKWLYLSLVVPILSGCNNTGINAGGAPAPNPAATTTAATTAAATPTPAFAASPFVGRWRKEVDKNDYVLHLKADGTYLYEEVTWKDTEKTKRLSNQLITGQWKIQNAQAVFLLQDSLSGSVDARNQFSKNVRAVISDTERSKLGFDKRLKVDFNVSDGSKGETILTKIADE